VNFCGAFARTDVMTEGVVAAIEELRPAQPIFFSIHGTGEERAIALVRDRLGADPYDSMDEAVRAAIAAARGGGEDAAARGGGEDAAARGGVDPDVQTNAATNVEVAR
jgi:succinyl-CoA synthetase beta subunit